MVVEDQPSTSTTTETVQYTSFKTPELTSSITVKPSLVKLPGLMKPFAHTIPVDKIHPVKDEIIVQGGSGQKPIKPHIIRNQGTFTDLERIVAIETFVKDTLEAEKRSSSTSSPTVSALPSSTTTTTTPIPTQRQSESESRHHVVARNSTFVKVDTIRPSVGIAVIEADDDDVIDPKTDDSEIPPPQQAVKKVYNDTLKANVVVDLVTLAPVKSNSGVGRPIRPRPKIDKVKQSTRHSAPILPNPNGTEEVSLLQRLFGGAQDDSKKHLIIQKKDPISPKNKSEEVGNVEQIVEVVTSISTRVSSMIQGDQMTLKLVITNTTDNEEVKPNATTSEEPNNSDRKIAMMDKNELLLESLRKIALVRVGNESVSSQVKDAVNTTKPLSGQQYFGPTINLDSMKKVTNITVGNSNRTVDKANKTDEVYALSRDGVPVLKRILHKVAEREDKMITNPENVTSKYIL